MENCVRFYAETNTRIGSHSFKLSGVHKRFKQWLKSGLIKKLETDVTFVKIKVLNKKMQEHNTAVRNGPH